MINRGDKEYEEEVPLQVPSARTQIVIANKRAPNGWLHPTSCAFCWDFIPEMENKQQELKCQDMLGDSLNLLLKPTRLNKLPLPHPRGVYFLFADAVRTHGISSDYNPTIHQVLYEGMGSKSTCDHLSSLTGVLTYGVSVSMGVWSVDEYFRASDETVGCPP